MTDKIQQQVEQIYQLDKKRPEDANRRYHGEISDQELFEKYPTKSQRAALVVNVMTLIEEDEKREREKKSSKKRPCKKQNDVLYPE